MNSTSELHMFVRFAMCFGDLEMSALYKGVKAAAQRALKRHRSDLPSVRRRFAVTIVIVACAAAAAAGAVAVTPFHAAAIATAADIAMLLPLLFNRCRSC
jgi:ElaB/YqjD/DUF883 family membrane-anchored ribosome-binding protein